MPSWYLMIPSTDRSIFRWFARAGLAVTFALGSISASAVPPAAIEITFDVMHNGMAVAEVVEKLEHDGRTYRASEAGKGRGALALMFKTARTSRGLVTASGLRPLEYTDERSGRPVASAVFDYAAKTLTQKYRGEPEVRPLPAYPSDRLAFALHFAFMESIPAAVTLDLADGRGVSTQIYEPAGRERIQVPAGDFDTLKIVRRPDGPNDRSAELWLAPAAGNLPVRIRVVEKDGTRTEQLATRVSIAKPGDARAAETQKKN